MQFTHIRLMVADMAASVRFYRDILGLALTMGGENDVYTEFEASPAILSLFRKDLMSPQVGTDGLPAKAAAQDAALLWFGVDDVDALHVALTAKGVSFVTPPTDRPAWGLRTIHFRDPDGNLIEVGHDIPMGE
jgi:catechol 2,3-dioxygenase-like lactoylglutathione lyase family enzyme